MELNPRTLVTIITESALEKSLIQDLRSLGAHGWTVTDARGEGSRGARSGDWDQSGNIRVEIVCERPKAEEILKHLRSTYYDNYAMIAFAVEVGVIRGEKF